MEGRRTRTCFLYVAHKSDRMDSVHNTCIQKGNIYEITYERLIFSSLFIQLLRVVRTHAYDVIKIEEDNGYQS